MVEGRGLVLADASSALSVAVARAIHLGIPASCESVPFEAPECAAASALPALRWLVVLTDSWRVPNVRRSPLTNDLTCGGFARTTVFVRIFKGAAAADLDAAEEDVEAGAVDDIDDAVAGRACMGSGAS